MSWEFNAYKSHNYGYELYMSVICSYQHLWTPNCFWDVRRAIAAPSDIKDLEYGCSMGYSMSQLAPVLLLLPLQAAQPFNIFQFKDTILSHAHHSFKATEIILPSFVKKVTEILPECQKCGITSGFMWIPCSHLQPPFAHGVLRQRWRRPRGSHGPQARQRDMWATSLLREPWGKFKSHQESYTLW